MLHRDPGRRMPYPPWVRRRCKSRTGDLTRLQALSDPRKVAAGVPSASPHGRDRLGVRVPDDAALAL